MKGLPRLAVGAVVAAFGGAALAALPPLFEGGQTAWKAVVPADAHPCVRYAAEELSNAVFRVSGAALPVVPSADGVAHAVTFVVEDAGWAPERVAYRLKGGRLVLWGNQPRAALHATYAFLDRELGVRWLWPGEDGAFYPARKSWAFPATFGFDCTPTIWFRGFHHCGDWRGRADFLVWQTRNYANIHRHGNSAREVKYGQYSMIAAHNANLNRQKGLMAEHPECFALLGGKRSEANVCFSSDLGAQKVAESIGNDVARRVAGANPVDIVSIFPNDNQDYCLCKDCVAQGVSTAWFRYYGKIVKALKKRFPELRFATIAYQGYLDVPDCTLTDTEFVEYASHSRCHVHTWNDETCASNVKEMRRFRQWCARDDVKIGHYAYEYDAVSAHSIFMPFFTMVGDAVEQAAKMKLVTQIPEVVLSPRTGPDIKADAVQNRLTILYYARKMWQPDLTLEAFLDDLCRTAYGRAAKPIKAYFLLLDKAWGVQPGRIGLFADGMNVSASLLADEAVRTRSDALLAEAESLAAADASRAQRNVARERALYRQWEAYRALRLGNNVSLKLPKREKGEASACAATGQMALRQADDRPGAVRVCGFWTPKGEIALSFEGAAEGEVSLVDAYAERYRFALRGGKRVQQRISDVGVEMTTWQPEWTAERKGADLVFRIPLSAFGHEPSAGEQWDVRFAAGAEALPWQEDVTIGLDFLAAPAAERPIVYFAGDSRCFRGIPALRARAEADGWRLIPCTNAAEFAAAVGKADTYLLQIPSRKDFSPETAAILRARVQAGGTLLARSWAAIPLETIFGDKTLACTCEAPKDYPLAERKAKGIRPGDWCRKPWDFERKLRNWFSPCYMMVPRGPADAWVEYASMPSRADESRMIPFVSAMRYGKGAIILVGETLHVSHFWLIDNIRRDLGL